MSSQSENFPEPPPAIERLLIVRLGSMGDIIHTLPAVTALRQAFPEATIGWVVERKWMELLCAASAARSGPRSPQRPLVDFVHVVETKGWRSALLSRQTWQEISDTISELRAEKYQVAADFQGAARSALISRWSTAPIIHGVTQPRENVASMFYSRQSEANGAHVVEQNLSLAEAIAGRRLEVPKIEFPHDQAAELESGRKLKERNITEFVMINPGAGWGAKQWPADRYGEVALQLGQKGLKSLINFGPGEGILARAVETSSRGAAEAISCSLPQLIALTRRARLAIGGDTGPLHLAAALNVPVVGIFGPTDPARNGPFGTCSTVLRSPSSLTSYSHRQMPDGGLLEITADQVVKATLSLLENGCG